MTHWADVEAQKLLDNRGTTTKQVFATAITPSGPIHVGNMREVLTTEAIYRGALDLDADAELIYIADDYDPLRKVYPFLVDNPAGIDYAEHVGKPLREIPCPCGEHDHYAQHFLEPFLGALEELGIRPTVLSAYDLYAEGRYRDAIMTAMDESDKIRTIIEEVSKRQLPKNWAPFNPQCPTCRSIKDIVVLDYVRPTLHARCRICAEGSDDPDAGTFEVDVRDGGAGKLPWRIDWPARWVFLGVTFEAFGKDHGASGGSWDTGKRIVRDIFGSQEPEHVMYEFLNLKGKGAMHSSTGLAIAATDILQMTPPEVLRYLLMRQSPRKHIDFDPGLGVLNLVDEFDRLERVRFGIEEAGDLTEVERTYELSCPNKPPAALPNKVAYRHLVTVAQMAEDADGVEAILRRSGELQGAMSPNDKELLRERVDHVRHWIQHFAPDNVRFEVQDTLPDYAFTEDDRAFLQELHTQLVRAEWNGQSIHDAVYAAKGERKPGEAFKALYQAILGQDRGPRAGFFLASLEREWVLERLNSASGA